MIELGCHSFHQTGNMFMIVTVQSSDIDIHMERVNHDSLQRHARIYTRVGRK